MTDGDTKTILFPHLEFGMNRVVDFDVDRELPVYVTFWLTEDDVFVRSLVLREWQRKYQSGPIHNKRDMSCEEYVFSVSLRWNTYLRHTLFEQPPIFQYLSIKMERIQLSWVPCIANHFGYHIPLWFRYHFL